MNVYAKLKPDSYTSLDRNNDNFFLLLLLFNKSLTKKLPLTLISRFRKLRKGSIIA